MGCSMFRKLIGLGFVALTSMNSILTVNSGVDSTPACKVNKNLITVYATSVAGEVVVEGKPGSITSTSEVVVNINNLISGVRVDVAVSEDMSFQGTIKANPGDKLRVNAQNVQGKKSYGTFDVSVGMPKRAQLSLATENSALPAVMEYDLPARAPALKEVAVEDIYEGDMAFNEDPEGGTNLSVIVMVINTDSGEVLTTKQINGKSRTYAEKSPKNFAIMIDRIVNRCTNIIKSEIFRPDTERTPIEALE